MNKRILEQLKKELVSRGFTAEGYSPHDTVGFDDTYLANVELADLLETMVARRERLFHSQAVVGEEPARKSYEDVVLVIDAIKNVMRHLALP
jgi:hypothetical protein